MKKNRKESERALPIAMRSSGIAAKELATVLALIPHLNPNDAADFAREIQDARAALAEVTDKWN